MKILLAPVPHDEAAKFIAGKPAVGRAVFDRLLPELKARAFTISGIEAADTLQRARDLIAALPQGADWDTQKSRLIGEISPYLVDDQADEETKARQVASAERSAETLMRLHGFQAYSAAQHQVMERQRDAFPSWQYMTFGDGNVRPSHAALNGIVLPADHPFWKDHFPPWDWGCRCQAVPVTAEESADASVAKAGAASGWAPGPEALKHMETTGMLDRGDGHPVDIRSPRKRAEESGEDPAAKFGWNPGDMKIPIEAIAARYKSDPVTWSSFENWAAGIRPGGGDQGPSLLELIGGNPPPANKSPLNPVTVSPPAKGKPGKPLSAAKMDHRVSAVSAEIVTSENEIFCVLGPDGKELFARHTSGPSGGKVPKEWLGNMSGATFVHNHPSGLQNHGYGRSFSMDDIRVAVSEDLKAIYAVSGRRFYKMEPGPGGWLSRATIQSAFDKHYADADDYLKKRVASGITAGWKANQMTEHLAWRRVAEELGMRYTVNRGK